MTTTFGDFLTLAGQRISAAAQEHDDLPAAAPAGVITELDRLLTVMTRHAHEALRRSRHDPSALGSPADDLAAPGASEMLDRAAENMHLVARQAPQTRLGMRHPLAADLRAAADCLTAGRDLLYTYDHWSIASSTNPSWVPLICSRPVSDALIRELAGYARHLAHLSARLLIPAAAHPAARIPPAAQGALCEAAGWLAYVGSAAAKPRQRGGDRDALLLHSIPANFPPPRHTPSGGENVAGLCAGTIATSDRLAHLSCPSKAGQSSDSRVDRARWRTLAAWNRPSSRIFS
jgi:hypothetical protein